MEQGPVEQKIIKDCVRYGMPLPDKIANAPHLQLGLEFYYHAFINLNTERRFGQVEGPIPWSAIENYGMRRQLDEEELVDLHFYVSTMDSAYLEYRKSKTTPPATK